METYSLLREFADSWMLLAMTLFFLGVILWAFRPGSRATHAEAGDIPFRNDSISPSASSVDARENADPSKIGGAS